MSNASVKPSPCLLALLLTAAFDTDCGKRFRAVAVAATSLLLPSIPIAHLPQLSQRIAVAYHSAPYSLLSRSE